MDVPGEIAAFIDREQLLQKNQTLVAAVSGGADSLCLMLCLQRLGYRPIVAHLDHQLRPESNDEANFVRQVAAKFKLDFVCEKADVASFSARGTSLEEAARILRYRFLLQVARDRGVRTIATGHTADDQAETVLMHLLRGAGVSGLRGMLPKTSLDTWVGIPDIDGAGLFLVRPLLCLWRNQTVAYCESEGLQPVQDLSNLDPSFYRNRLRHHLLPIMETYNPEIRSVLNRTARLMAVEAAWLETVVAQHWPTMVRTLGEQALGLRVDAFLALPTALRWAMVREAIRRLRPTLRDVGFEAVGRACRFLEKRQRGKRLPLIGGLMALHLGDEIVIFEADSKLVFPEYPQLVRASEDVLPIPGKVTLDSGWVLEVKHERLTKKTRDAILGDRSGNLAAMDVATIQAPLGLRPRQASDRIRPLGMKGSIKVADLFVNQHVPQPVRKLWPLVVSADRVLWVAGLRMSADVRITRRSREAIVLRLIEP